jgi:hypothetical protein
MSEIPYFKLDSSKRMAVNPKRVKELFNYDKKDGKLTWKKRECGWFKDVRSCKIFNSKFPGKTTGCDDGKGYLQVRMLGKLYFVHRLVWAWHHGEWPPAGYDIDHIDKNTLNNKIENLRIATRSQNNVNTHKSKVKNKVKGYTRVENKNGTVIYIAQSSWKGKHYHLGVFRTKEEAISAYTSFAKKHHGEFYAGEHYG